MTLRLILGAILGISAGSPVKIKHYEQSGKNSIIAVYSRCKMNEEKLTAAILFGVKPIVD